MAALRGNISIDYYILGHTSDVVQHKQLNKSSAELIINHKNFLIPHRGLIQR